MREKITNICGINYLVREDGRIFSTHRFDKDGNPKEIKQRLNPDGYYSISVGKQESRSQKTVHKIVADTFIPSNDKSLEVDHKDNDRTHNELSNLQRITHAENVKKIPIERRSECRKGSKNGRAKLCEQDVKSIRRMFVEGYTKAELARQFNCGWTTIQHIIKGDTWN